MCGDVLCTQLCEMTCRAAGDTASLRLLRLEDDEPVSLSGGRGGRPECRGWSSVAGGACLLDPTPLAALVSSGSPTTHGCIRHKHSVQHCSGEGISLIADIF